MGRVLVSTLILLWLATSVSLHPTTDVKVDQIQLSTILPKLRAIHEDAQNLLIKNSELKSKILGALQAQNEAKLKEARESKLLKDSSKPVPLLQGLHAQPSIVVAGSTIPKETRLQEDKDGAIDYVELEEFNKWVDANLEYAVKNTHASIEALKEEAALNNGKVDYSEQAVNDGIEGIKYWQSAVIFQDKTLNNEKFEIE